MVFDDKFTEVSAGEDSFIQLNMLKGTYHNHDGRFNNNLTDAIATVLNRETDQKTKEYVQKKLDDFSRLDAEILHYKEMIRQSNSGEIYLSLAEKRQRMEDLRVMKSDILRIRQEIGSYLLKSMAKHKILEKEITPMILDKMPMFFRGGFRKGESEDTDEMLDDLDAPVED